MKHEVDWMCAASFEPCLILELPLVELEFQTPGSLKVSCKIGQMGWYIFTIPSSPLLYIERLLQMCVSDVTITNVVHKRATNTSEPPISVSHMVYKMALTLVIL